MSAADAKALPLEQLLTTLETTCHQAGKGWADGTVALDRLDLLAVIRAARLAAPPLAPRVVYGCQFCKVLEPERHKDDCPIIATPSLPPEVVAVLEAVGNLTRDAAPPTTDTEWNENKWRALDLVRALKVARLAWIAAGRHGLPAGKEPK